MGATQRKVLVKELNRAEKANLYWRSCLSDDVSSETLELIDVLLTSKLGFVEVKDTKAIFARVVRHCDEMWKEDEREWVLRNYLESYRQVLVLKAQVEKY